MNLTPDSLAIAIRNAGILPHEQRREVTRLFKQGHGINYAVDWLRRNRPFTRNIVHLAHCVHGLHALWEIRQELDFRIETLKTTS